MLVNLMGVPTRHLALLASNKRRHDGSVPVHHVLLLLGRTYRRVQRGPDVPVSNPNTFVDEAWQGGHETVAFELRAERWVCIQDSKEPESERNVEAIRLAECTRCFQIWDRAAWLASACKSLNRT